MKNMATFNGEEFWIGSVNNQDGTIEEVHTYEEAQSYDFHHSFYFSQQQLENIDDSICSVFWIEEDGDISGEFWRNEGRRPWIIGKIYEQIELFTEREIKTEKPNMKPTSKIKKWKEWQKPFESKLYENPDTLRWVQNGEKKKLHYQADDAITFGYVDEQMIVGGKGTNLSHGELCYEDRQGMKYPGRLWVDSKIITFWEYPSKEEMNNVIKDIQDTYNKGYVVSYERDDENKKMIYEYEDKDKLNIDDNWRIEVVTDESGEIKDPNTKFFSKKILKTLGMENKIIPLKDYSGSEKRSEEELKAPHMMSPMEKEEYYKKNPDKRPKKIKKKLNLPKGMSQAQYRHLTKKSESMKYLKKFEGYMNNWKPELTENEEFMKVIEWLREEWSEETVLAWLEENCSNYVGDEREDYCEDMGYDEDECEDVSDEEVYKHYAMGGAVTYDAIDVICGEVKEKFPDEYEKYEDEIDEYVSGLCGDQGFDMLTNYSSEMYDNLR